MLKNALTSMLEPLNKQGPGLCSLRLLWAVGQPGTGWADITPNAIDDGFKLKPVLVNRRSIGVPLSFLCLISDELR